MERIMEELSFQAAEEGEGATMTVNKELVSKRLEEVVKRTDMSKYIL